MNVAVDWKLSNLPLADLGFAIANTVTQLAHEQLTDLADLFPFKGNWESEGHVSEDWIAIRLKERRGAGLPVGSDLKGAALEELLSAVTPFVPGSHAELAVRLGSNWFGFSVFTYVGPCQDATVSWSHLQEHVVDWLNRMVVPEVLRRNQARVLRAIPTPPRYDLELIRSALWVLECDETQKQGTAFHLAGTGLVTCAHVLGPATIAFQAQDVTRRRGVAIQVSNDAIDLAILRIEDLPSASLSRGSADNLSVMDHLAVAGFPNYRLGDSGIFVPGLVVGFRVVSGIRRILTNAPIVAGNSGGPVLSSDGSVVGVAVTGTDVMDRALETENHGIIPIDALHYLAQ